MELAHGLVKFQGVQQQLRLLTARMSSLRSDAIGKLEQWIDALEMIEGANELQDCSSAFAEAILKQASVHDVLGLLALTLALKYVSLLV